MSGGLSGVAGNTSVEVGGARRKVPQQVGFVPASVNIMLVIISVTIILVIISVIIILVIISVIIIVGNISVTIIVVSLNVVRFPNSNLS